ncbi:MAG: 4Fe-4S dicluster domain-containing protein [Chloroflexi bacterium]|nr:4Fe-4S dicluster domain-containing protein [Chloroflexota bacterium]
MSQLDEFVRIFQLPPAMLPYVDFVVQGREMELVVGLDDTALTAEEIAEMLRMPRDQADAFILSAYHRMVIAKDTNKETGVVTYKAGKFYRRLDPLSMYENWGDVPAEARNAVIDWQLEEFIGIWLPVVEEIKNNPDVYVKIPNRDVLLLEEALAMVEAASDHVVVPCDCRAIVMACQRPSEACIRLDEGALRTLEQGHGRRVTKEEMKAIVVNTDREGLMHTGSRNWRERGAFGFCNCCGCDCYPFRAGVKLGMFREWPRAHHVADCDWEKCTHCGKCTRRCHFSAFHLDGTRTLVNGKNMRTVRFDASKCVGCGLCANACDFGAITMKPLRAPAEPRADGAPVIVDKDAFTYYEQMEARRAPAMGSGK